MALIDVYTLFSDKQVIGTKNVYSQKAWDLQAEIDFGQSNMNHYICVQVMGAFTNGLTIQLIKANKADFSDAQVLQASPQYTAGQLKPGFRHFFTVTPTGEKYRYLCLKYLPTGATDNDDTEHEDTMCPPTPVLGGEDAPANSVTAWHQDVADFPTKYRNSQDGKMTA